MDYKNFLNSLKKDLLEANELYPSVKFFRKDIVCVWIWFLILDCYYNENVISSEKIINIIPSKYSSRPKIFNIINTACDKNYLLKILDEKDKRKFNLKPTKLCISEFENWAKIFKGF